MDFYAILDQVVELLRRRGRVTYRALQLQFQLDDAALEVLRDELIKAQHVAVDEQGDVLVWTGGPDTTAASVLPASQPGQPSASQDARAPPPAATPRPRRFPHTQRGAAAPPACPSARRRATKRSRDRLRLVQEGRADRCTPGRRPREGRLGKAGGAPFPCAQEPVVSPCGVYIMLGGFCLLCSPGW